MQSRISGKDCVIGIEAKVSEPFGKEIGKQQKSTKGNISKRAELLRASLTPAKTKDEVSAIGYQLFTATRGTMCAALEHGVEKCIMLVITFKGNVEKGNGYDRKCAKNVEDFDDFLKATGADGNGRIAKEIDDKAISCWIKQIDVTV